MKRYTVEWLTDVPMTDGTGDPDAGKEHEEHFKTEREAVAFAKSVVDADYWGSPRVCEEEYRAVECYDGGPLHKTWDHVRDIEIG